ncbi:MAG: hypothetical protein PHO70_04995 [Candidatus Omnitrophica bacterium]|nr:hypothetical protein [Candidatus Omnitrophota bacterium]
MEEKKDFYKVIEALSVKDKRYKPDAYEFVMQGLHYTQNKLKKETHVSGKELLEGLRDLAIDQYGPMAKTVLTHWGVFKTQDFGNIVFNMVKEKILAKTDEDSIDDFKDVYDFNDCFGNVLKDLVIKDI